MSTFLGRRPDPDGGADTYFVQTDGEEMTRDLNDPATVVIYYLIKESSARNASLESATLKAGARAPGDSLEVAETEAESVVVADAQVRV